MFFPSNAGKNQNMKTTEKRALLVLYAASGVNFLQTFRENLFVPSFLFLTHKDGADRLSRNVGKKLPLLVA
jgi:hypothetical protein